MSLNINRQHIILVEIRVTVGIVQFIYHFSFLAMALSVCFRFMSLTVPLVSFVPLFLANIEIEVDSLLHPDLFFKILDRKSSHSRLVYR